MISAKAHHFPLKEHIRAYHRQALFVVDIRHCSFHQRIRLDIFFFSEGSPSGDEALAFEGIVDFIGGQASWADIFICLKRMILLSAKKMVLLVIYLDIIR